MAKQTWKGGAMLSPVPPALVTCSDGEHDNVLTIAWTGIVNTIPPKTYISVRPSRHSYEIIKKSGVFAINLTTEQLVRRFLRCPYGREDRQIRAMLPLQGARKGDRLPDPLGQSPLA